MKRCLMTSLSLTVALFLLAAPAFGQISKDGELNLFFGVSTHSANKFQVGAPQAVPAYNAKFELMETLRGGVRVNVATNGHWGEEFYYSFEHNRARYTILRRVDLGIQLHNFGGTALYYFSSDEKATMRPFLSMGLGASWYRPTKGAKIVAADPTQGNLPGFGESHELNFHYGVGFKRQMTKAWGFRMDLRHIIGRNPSFNMSKSSANSTENAFPADGVIHNLEATGGLIFYFGR